MKRLFQLFLFLLVGAAAFGWYRGWFTTATVSAGGKSSLTFTWDPERFGADMNAAGAKIKSLSAAATAKIQGKTTPVDANTSTLTGKVSAVDAAARTVTIVKDGEAIGFTVPEAMTGIEQLVGRNVKVTIERVGERLVVREIAALD